MKAQGGGLPETSRGGVRLAFRMARRMALQSPGRSILVAVLIAVPIVGVAGIDTVEASRVPTTADTIRFELGKTQARLTIVSPPDPQMQQDPLGNGYSSGSDPSGTERTPAEILPAGTRILGLTSTNVVARTAHGLAAFSATQGPAWDASFAGMTDVTAGHTPTKSSEIMVTGAGLARFGIALGGTVHVTKPRIADFTVVGTLRNVGSPSSYVQLFGVEGAFDGLSADHNLTASEFYLPDHAVPWSEVKAINRQGALVESREVILHPPKVTNGDTGPQSGSDVLVAFVALLGAFGLFEVCLLAGAAFAVGARHRQRELAILASVGAERRTIFAVMSIEGILLGFVGGVVGTGLGILGAAIAEPLISGGVPSMFPNFRVDVPVLALVVLASTVSGCIAAAIPARAASRVDVVGALRGARRPPRLSARRPLVGLFIAAGGSVIALMGGLVIIGSKQAVALNNHVFTTGIVLLVAGPIFMQIGALLIAPLLLRWVTGVLARWGAGARLGSRDASRNPSRTVPALAAIMSTVFVSAFVMCLLSGTQTLTTRSYAWQAPLHLASVNLYQYTTPGVATLAKPDGVAAALDRSFPGSSARILSSTPDLAELGDKAVSTYTVPRVARTDTSPWYFSTQGTGDHLLVGDEQDLATVLGEPLTASSRATLEHGGFVSLYPQYVHDGLITIDTVAAKGAQSGDTPKPLKTVRVAASVQEPPHETSFATFTLASTARQLGIPFAPSMVVSQLPSAPTSAETDAAYAAVQVVNSNFSVSVEDGPQKFAATWSWALVGLTTLIALVSSGVALWLARADARRDDEVLAAIGASPRLQRAFGFWQATIIAGLGAVTGTALGLVPAFALGIRGAGVTHGFIPFEPPWLQLGLTAVAMPLLIAGGAWLLTRRPRQLTATRRTPMA